MSEKKFTFRVKAGRHVGSKHDGAGGRVFLTGDKVETDTDLIALHGPEKFELLRGPKNAAKTRSTVDPRSKVPPGTDEDEDPKPYIVDETPAPSSEDAPETEDAEESPDFDTMSIGQLREYAAENEIDLTGLNTKASILKKLKAG